MNLPHMWSNLPACQTKYYTINSICNVVTKCHFLSSSWCFIYNIVAMFSKALLRAPEIGCCCCCFNRMIETLKWCNIAWSLSYRVAFVVYSYIGHFLLAGGWEVKFSELLWTGPVYININYWWQICCNII